ncbi:MAG: hypothetical protein J0H35_03005, partial [Rhodospirillales bacterium]|nr:hypothetical protein [Rhodospirillales bacterium]
MSRSRTAGFGIVITGDDRQAASTLDALNKRIQAIRAPIDQTNKSLSRLSENTGLASLGRGFRDLSLHSQSAFENIGRIVAPLAAITSAASVAGLARLTTQWADMGAKLSFSAQRAGMTAGQLSVLQGAARIAGSSAESLTAGMTALNDNLTNAAAGRAPQAAMAFNYLGINADHMRKSIGYASDLLPEIADKIAAIKDPTIQSTVATMLFGGAADELLPTLRQGAAGLAENSDKARRYGAMNDRAAEAANELRKKQVELTLAVEGVGNTIAEKLAPVISPLMLDLTTWIENNRQLIGTDIARWVRDAVPAVESFGKEANKVAEALGGWKAVLEGIVAIKLATWAATAVANMNPLVRLTLLTYLGFKGAEHTGRSVAAAAESGLTPAMYDPEGINPIMYRDAAGRLYSPDEAARLSRNRVFPGEGGMEALGQNPTRGSAPASVPITDEQQKQNLSRAREYLLQQGWTPEQTAGILANLNAESQFNPGAVGDNGTSFGVAQWHNDRAQQFQQVMGKDIRGSSLDDQLKFLQWELTNTEKGAGDMLRATRTARQAAAVVSLRYERPAGGVMEAGARANGAERFLQPPVNVQGGTGTSAARAAQTEKGSLK